MTVRGSVMNESRRLGYDVRWQLHETKDVQYSLVRYDRDMTSLTLTELIIKPAHVVFFFNKRKNIIEWTGNISIYVGLDGLVVF